MHLLGISMWEFVIEKYNKGCKLIMYGRSQRENKLLPNNRRLGNTVLPKNENNLPYKLSNALDEPWNTV